MFLVNQHNETWYHGNQTLFWSIFEKKTPKSRFFGNLNKWGLIKESFLHLMKEQERI